MSNPEHPAVPSPVPVWLDELAPGPTPAQVRDLTGPSLTFCGKPTSVATMRALGVVAQAASRAFAPFPTPASNRVENPEAPAIRVWLSPAERREAGLPLRANFIGTRQRRRAARQQQHQEARASRRASSPGSSAAPLTPCAPALCSTPATSPSSSSAAPGSASRS